MKALKSIGIIVVLAMALAAGAQEDRKVLEQIAEAVKVYRSGDVDGAKKSFIELYEKNPNQADILSWLGFLYLRTGEPQKAVEVLEKVMPLKKDDLEVRNNLGAAYVQTNQPERAFVEYRALAEMDPKRFEPWYNMGNIHLAKKEYSTAAAAYSKANEIRPDDPFVLNNLGVSNEALGNVGAAGDYFARASNLNSDNKTFARNAGYAYVKVNRPDKAQPMLERAYRMDTGDSQLGMVLAGNYAKMGNKTAAMRLYKELASSQGNNAAYWFNMGVLMSSTDPKGAEQAYRHALELNGSDIDVLRNLGLLVYQRGDYKQAATYFDKWAGVDPNSMDAKINLAAASAKSANVPRAIELWERILKSEPRRLGIRVSLANALWQAEEREQARSHYQVILQQDPKNAVAHNGLGLYHLSQENLLEAETSFRSAVKHDSKFIQPYNNLAVTLERLNRRKEAIAVLEQGLMRGPGTFEMKTNLERIKKAEADSKRKKKG